MTITKEKLEAATQLIHQGMQRSHEIGIETGRAIGRTEIRDMILLVLNGGEHPVRLTQHDYMEHIAYLVRSVPAFAKNINLKAAHIHSLDHEIERLTQALADKSAEVLRLTRSRDLYRTAYRRSVQRRFDAMLASWRVSKHPTGHALKATTVAGAIAELSELRISVVALNKAIRKAHGVKSPRKSPRKSTRKSPRKSDRCPGSGLGVHGFSTKDGKCIKCDKPKRVRKVKVG